MSLLDAVLTVLRVLWAGRVFHGASLVIGSGVLAGHGGLRVAGAQTVGVDRRWRRSQYASA